MLGFALFSTQETHQLTGLCLSQTVESTESNTAQ